MGLGPGTQKSVARRTRILEPARVPGYLEEVVRPRVDVWRRRSINLSGCPAFVPGVSLWGHSRFPFNSGQDARDAANFAVNFQLRKTEKFVLSGMKYKKTSCF
jgi:hypothetical protein